MKKLLKSPLFYFNLFLVVIIGILITMPSVAQKVTAAVGNILGQGTPNLLAQFTGANQIGNSQIYDNGSNVGIGTTNPSGKLHVSGNVRADTGFCIGANCITAWPTGGGTLTGSGTTNKLVKWTGTNSLGDSAVSEISNTLIKVGSLSLGSSSVGTGVLTDSGSFGVGNLSATAYANVLANDYYIGALGKWVSQAFLPTVGGSKPTITSSGTYIGRTNLGSNSDVCLLTGMAITEIGRPQCFISKSGNDWMIEVYKANCGVMCFKF